MFPKARKDDKTYCGRTSCPWYQHRDETSLQSSQEDMHWPNVCKNISKETQLSTITTTSCDRNTVPARQITIIRQHLANDCEGHQIQNHHCNHKKYPINLKIPIEIHFKTFSNNFNNNISDMAKISLKDLRETDYSSCESSTEETDVSSELDCSIYSCSSRSTQTDNDFLYVNRLRPNCWYCINKCHGNEFRKTKCFQTIESKSNHIKKLQNYKCVRDKKSSTTTDCSCPSCESACVTNYCDWRREKLSKEEYNEIVQKSVDDEAKSRNYQEKSSTESINVEKVYRLAYPQHKDLDICVRCQHDPSPLIDKNGLVFCPGNCGCCLCPWKTRANTSLQDVLRHSKIKLCKCANRLTVFGDNRKLDYACSQISYFDLCPCREKAEAKHLELYGCEMGKNVKNNIKSQGQKELPIKAIQLRDGGEVMHTKGKTFT